MLTFILFSLPDELVSLWAVTPSWMFLEISSSWVCTRSSVLLKSQLENEASTEQCKSLCISSFITSEFNPLSMRSSCRVCFVYKWFFFPFAFYSVLTTYTIAQHSGAQWTLVGWWMYSSNGPWMTFPLQKSSGVKSCSYLAMCED